MDNQQVINNTAEKQFQYHKNGHTAVIDYKIMGNKLLLLATRVPRKYSPINRELEKARGKQRIMAITEVIRVPAMNAMAP